MSIRKKLDISKVQAAQLSSQGSDSDLAYLKSHGPRALPTDPTAAKWSAAAILKQLYSPSEINFSWLKRLAEAILELAENMDDYLDVEAADTLHKSGTETITGSKSFGTSGSDNSKTLDIYFTTNLRGPVYSNTIIPGNTFALGSAEHYWGEAYIDDIYLYGIITDGMYEWAMPLKNGTVALTSDVGNLEDDITDGTVIAKKAKQDEDGNSIKGTYETKSDATAKVARANLVSILGNASSSLAGLMSDTDKSRLDALYALLGASSDSDTVVNTINEVLAIFAQYPEGVTLTNALATKVNVSDVVDAYTSSETTKPLSAAKGKDLNDRLEDVEENYVGHDDVFAAGMMQVVEYDQSTGKITIKYNSDVMSISYTSSTGVLTISY